MGIRFDFIRDESFNKNADSEKGNSTQRTSIWYCGKLRPQTKCRPFLADIQLLTSKENTQIPQIGISGQSEQPIVSVVVFILDDRWQFGQSWPKSLPRCSYFLQKICDDHADFSDIAVSIKRPPRQTSVIPMIIGFFHSFPNSKNGLS